MRVAPGVDVGERVDSERCRVGSHVQPVGQQRHRAVDEPGHDLDDHHDPRDRDHDERARLARAFQVLPERVRVFPGFSFDHHGG